NNEPLFIHSSWRSGETWFSFLFRRFPQTAVFYEPYHEDLATITLQEVTKGGPNPEAGHPGTLPYFLEYARLLRRSGGVRLFRPEMSYDWFIPDGGALGTLRHAEVQYLALLIRRTQRSGQIPILAFSRSLGRIGAIKKCFGGTHVVITRNLC